MTPCPYVYCDAALPDGSDACPTCGHPRDVGRLQSSACFAELVLALKPRLPDRLLDLHQILPVHPRILPYQLGAMDALGIEHALLQSAPDAATTLSGNAALLEVQQAHPDRFWTSWFVDPAGPDAHAALDAAVAAGVRVIKLLPVTGWDPDDDALWPFWDALQAAGCVAMVHTGFFTARHRDEEARAGRFMRSWLGDPLRFDRVCRAFPDLRVILCHAGGSVYAPQAAEMMRQHPNVWGDLSGSGRFALRLLLSQPYPVDWAKLFWGNDSPPYAYPLNLRLLLHDLEAAGRTDLTEPLLYSNGARFAAEALAPVGPA
ncbi:MAG: amidohydrolase family protein [Myxococcota bacterium]